MYMDTQRKGVRWPAILALVALIFGACGGGDQDSPVTASTTTTTQAPTTTTAVVTTTTAAATTTTTASSVYPVEVQDSRGAVTIPARP